MKDSVKTAIRNLLHTNIDIHGRSLIAEFRRDGLKRISKLHSHCTNITFSDKSRYDRLFQIVTHKEGVSSMNYIKIFQNAHALSVSVGNSYSEDHFMHIFLDKFRQGEKYTAQISIHHAKLRRKINSY